MNKTLVLLLAIISFISCKDTASSENEKSIVYFNGDIITMQGDQPNYVEALVVKDGKINYTGDSNRALEIVGVNHKMVDLKGKTLLPGFIDGHAHFSSFGVQAFGAQILPPPDAGANNIPTLIEILKQWNTEKNRALTGWIFGMGFDDSVLEEKRFPTKKDLDLVSTEYPIMIIHISGHFASLNSKGLELLGINSDTKDPEGGIIRRLPNSNEPNGVLEELAAIPNLSLIHILTLPTIQL